MVCSSKEFAITQVGDFAVKLPAKDSSEDSNYLARVEIQLHGATFLIIFKAMTPEIPPYLIENQTVWPLKCWQKVRRSNKQSFSLWRSCCFEWKFPLFSYFASLTFSH